MIDACSKTDRRFFMPGQKFDVPQNECSYKMKAGSVVCNLSNPNKI